MTTKEDTAEEAAEEEVAAVTAEAEAMAAREICTRQPVLNAGRNAKCLSSRPKADRYIAGTASQSTGNFSLSD